MMLEADLNVLTLSEITLDGVPRLAVKRLTHCTREATYVAHARVYETFP